MVVVSIQVPPCSKVFRRCTKILHNHELCQIAEDVVDEWAPPDFAFLIHTDTVVRSTKSVEGVYVEVSTSLDYGTRYQSTL